jgi:hypothetical protein
MHGNRMWSTRILDARHTHIERERHHGYWKPRWLRVAELGDGWGSGQSVAGAGCHVGLHPITLERSCVQKGRKNPMSTGPAFWLIMAVGAAVLLGVGLAYGLISRRRRRETKRGEGTENDHRRDGKRL